MELDTSESDDDASAAPSSPPRRPKRWKRLTLSQMPKSPVCLDSSDDDSLKEAMHQACGCDSATPAARVDPELADSPGRALAQASTPDARADLAAADGLEDSPGDSLEQALKEAADDTQLAIPLTWCGVECAGKCESKGEGEEQRDASLSQLREPQLGEPQLDEPQLDASHAEQSHARSAAQLPAIIIIMQIMLDNLLKYGNGACHNVRGNMATLVQCIADSCCTGMTLTTACSGTDLVCPVLQAFFGVLQDRLHTASVRVQHLWSCENIGWKADWIEQVVKMPLVFRDIHELPNGLAHTHRWIQHFVSAGLLHVVGFSCKSVSMLNNFRSKFQKCIKKRSGTTGSSFWSTWKFARRYRPVFLWLENVFSFRGSNLKMAVKLLRALGYCVVVLVLSLERHGVPCRRKRTWILASLDPENSTVAGCLAAQLEANNVELALRQQPLPMESFLLPDDALPQQKPGRKRKSDDDPLGGSFAKRRKWTAAHKVAWAKKGISKPRVLPEPLSGMVAKEGLSKREAEVALYDRLVHSRAYETSAERIVDLSQSISRYPHGSECCPTITPAARMALLNRKHPRLMVGQERLALQGFVAEGESAENMLNFTDRPSIQFSFDYVSFNENIRHYSE